MFKLLVYLILINIFVFGLGAGWFGIIPSEIPHSTQTKLPTEFRPQAITFTKD